MIRDISEEKIILKKRAIKCRKKGKFQGGFENLGKKGDGNIKWAEKDDSGNGVKDFQVCFYNYLIGTKFE